MGRCFCTEDVRGFASMETEKKRLLWGAALAWVPVLVVIVPMVVMLNREKATGLAVVAAEMTETLVTFGVIAFVACQLGAIVLLAWEIRRAGWGRTAFCLVSIGCSLVVLTAVLLSVWSVWHGGGS
jgi:hypothetical protein